MPRSGEYARRACVDITGWCRFGEVILSVYRGTMPGSFQTNAPLAPAWRSRRPEIPRVTLVRQYNRAGNVLPAPRSPLRHHQRASSVGVGWYTDCFSLKAICKRLSLETRFRVGSEIH